MAIIRKIRALNDAIDYLNQSFVRAGNDVLTAMESLSPAELQFIQDETEKCFDLRYYLENYHCIRDEEGNFRTLCPWWDHQEMAYEAINEEFADHGFCKMIILKPRQTGLTTWIGASMFHRTIINPHTYTMMVAQDPPTSGNMYTMCVNAYQALPWWLRPESQYNTKGDEIVFQRKDENIRLVDPGLGSTIKCSHAQKSAGVAIGRTIRNLHASEVSRWPGADVFHADINPSLNASDTYGIMESTGFGRNGLMYEWWQGSEEGDTGWRPFFIPVYKVRKYYLPIKGPFEKTEEETKFTARTKAETGFAIPDEFWNFRRRGLRSARRGNGKSGFLESYPITPTEAFQSSGMCAFDRECLEDQQLKNVCRPIWAGDIILDGNDQTPRPNVREVGDREVLAKRKGMNPTDLLHIWKLPEDGQVYYVAADSALGVQEGDYSCCQVIRVGMASERDEQVAEWLGHRPPGQFARVTTALGYWYNGAEIAIEYQGPGTTVGDKVKDMDYPALYRPQHRDRVGNTMGVHLHWLTTVKTRDGIIGALNEGLIEDSVIIHSEDLIDECIDFASMNGGGRYEGQDNNDDVVMSFMICLYCARETQQYLKASPATTQSRAAADINNYGVFDEFGRQRGMYGSKVLAEQQSAGKRGWTAQPILVCKANTIWSPIYNGDGAESELRFTHGMPSTTIIPDVVNPYRASSQEARLGLPGSPESADW